MNENKVKFKYEFTPGSNRISYHNDCIKWIRNNIGPYGTKWNAYEKKTDFQPIWKCTVVYAFENEEDLVFFKLAYIKND